MSPKMSSQTGLSRLGAHIAPIVIVCAIVFALPLILNNDFLLNKVARYLVLGILTDLARRCRGALAVSSISARR